jgi:hypothetical protein
MVSVYALPISVYALPISVYALPVRIVLDQHHIDVAYRALRAVHTYTRVDVIVDTDA